MPRKTADRRAWEGFGADDPHSGRAQGRSEPDEFVERATPADERRVARQAAQRDEDFARSQGGTTKGGPRTAKGVAAAVASDDAPTPRRRSPSSSPRRSSTSSAQTGAGVVLGLVAFALFRNFLQGGPAQARAWLAAKFLNRGAGTMASAQGPGVGVPTPVAGAVASATAVSSAIDLGSPPPPRTDLTRWGKPQ